MNPFEYARRNSLLDLKKEYSDVKRTIEILQDRDQVKEAKELELKAQQLSEEIIKLDPDFAKITASRVEREFKTEADELNQQQHEKIDYQN